MPLPCLSRLARVLGLAALESASVGLAVWSFAAHAVLPAHARENALMAEARRFIFYDMSAALGVAAVILAALFTWKRREGLEVVERLVRRMSPLALAAILPLLFDTRLWADRDLVFLLLALAFGFGAWACARAILDTPPAFPRLAGHLRGAFNRVGIFPRRAAAAFASRVDAPLAVVALGACAYAAYFSVVTIVSHRNLGTSSFDLGLEDNLMWNLIHGGPIFRSSPFDPSGTHLRHHATFFSFVLAPIYALAPRPETLLVVQAVMMGAAAMPLHLYARRHLAPWTATLVAFLYLAYPPLHGANLYDFHYLPLGVFFLWLVLYAVEARRPWLAIATALFAMSVREDVACCLAVVGLLLLLTGAAARAGALLAFVAGGYFLVMKLGVMPRFGTGESFINQYAGLLPPDSNGFGGVLQTVVGNPVFTENVVLEKDKATYVLELMVPLLFVPISRPIGLLLVVPGFLFTLLSTRYPPLNQISFQYTSYWTPFLFVGLVLALEWARRARHGADTGGPTRQRALVAGVVAASLACSYGYGAVLQRQTARGGFDRFRFDTTDADRRHRADLAGILGQLPAGASVCASEHLLPHVSGRADAYTLRFGIHDADYMLFQLPPRGDEREPLERALGDGSYGVVDARGDIVLTKRGEATSGNAPVLEKLH